MLFNWGLKQESTAKLSKNEAESVPKEREKTKNEMVERERKR